MRSNHISSREWWWVAIISSVLVTITLIPYAWSLIASDDTYQFMGILANPKDGATYISKIQQGVDGAWLFELRHTPQKHDPAGFHVFYLMLGQLANLFGLSAITVFHLARVITSFFMFFSFYELAAAIWQRQRPRRFFFLLVSVGSGLGWVSLIIYSSEELAPDLTVAEAFPLLAAYTNAHFPLALGVMALMTSKFVRVFRPGFEEAPTSDNGGLLLVVLSIILSIISPPGLIVIGAALLTYTLASGLAGRTLPIHEVRWVSMVVLPGIPFAAYLFAVFQFNETMSAFNDQNITLAPHIILLFFSFGLLWLIAVPAIIRAARRFEPDGDQLMLIWLVVNVFIVYTPGFNLQRRLIIGIIFPTCYFVVRAYEDYWHEKLTNNLRSIAFIVLTTLIIPSYILTFGAPLAFSVFVRDSGAETGLLLDTDYVDMFEWLDNNARRDEVLLASPVIGLWTPARSGLRPYYGHEFETVPAEENLKDVRQYYRGENCMQVFDDDLPFDVRYVAWGPQEDNLGKFDAEEDDIDQVLRDDFDNLQFSDDEGDETTSPLPSPADLSELRLATADDCRNLLDEQGLETQEFGDVTLYILAD